MASLLEAIKGFFVDDDRVEKDKNLVSQIEAMEKAEVNKKARELTLRLLAWYHRDREAIVDYIKKQAAVTFGDKTEKWQIPVVNGVPRTVKRLAMTYATPPERVFYKKGAQGKRTQLKEDSEEMARIRAMYGGDLARKDRAYRDADRMSVLGNTVHMEPCYRRGRIELDLHMADTVAVHTASDDYLEFSRWAKQHEFPNEDPLKEPKKGWRYWDEEKHVLVRSDGAIYALEGDNPANPYKGLEFKHNDRPIPILTIRKRNDRSYWGRYGADIVDAAEQVCIQLGNLWENGFLQTHGIPVLINTGLSKKSGKVVLGAREPFVVDNVGKDDMPPSITFATPDPKIDIMRALIDWFLKINGASYGLPPSAWAEAEKALSGFAKLVDNLELLEDREEDLTDWVEIEQREFEWSVIKWNRNEPKMKIDDAIEMDVIPKEIEFPQSAEEEAVTMAAQIAEGVASPVDWIMKKEKISTREEALQRAKDIAKEKQILAKFGMPVMPPFGDDTDPNDKGKPGENDPEGEGGEE